MEMEMASGLLKTRSLDPALQKAAIQVAALLPNNLTEALAVLELAKQQVIEYFGEATSSALAAG
jgi:hypothetical protein